jgi:hypothetical protein
LQLPKFAYHRVHLPFIGNEILSLNELVRRYPDHSNVKEYLSKYEGREEELETIVHSPYKWLDYAYLGLHHPQLVLDSLKQAGFNDLDSIDYFKIPLDRINPDPNYTTVWLFTEDCPLEAMNFDDCLTLSEARAQLDVSRLPTKTIAHHVEAIAKDEIVFRWLFAPHLMTRSPIDISNCEIITVS